MDVAWLSHMYSLWWGLTRLHPGCRPGPSGGAKVSGAGRAELLVGPDTVRCRALGGTMDDGLAG